MQALHDQIIRLIRNIRLRPSTPSERPSAQFFAGKHSPFRFPNGIGLNWWYGGETFRARDAVASMIVGGSRKFQDCDLDTASDSVMRTLKEVCIDSSIFDGDAVVFGKKETLFECRSVSIQVLASAVSEAIKANLLARLGRCCTVHVVPRIKLLSFQIRDLGIHAIDRHDNSAWQRLIDDGFVFNGWTPENPQGGLRRDSAFAPQVHFDCVLAVDSFGTKSGARFSSILKLRVLLAVILSVATARAQRPATKSQANPSQFFVQFPHMAIPEGTITRTEHCQLLPYYLDDIPIGSAEVMLIRDWYEKLLLLDEATRNRIEKAGHFLNLGMNADETEAYINYFVTLDALLGKRNAVEASILGGMAKLKFDEKYIEKARWLFDLRNELVHGGSRYVEEWPDYTRYIRHFRTKPTEDIQRISQLAVLRAPYALSRDLG